MTTLDLFDAIPQPRPPPPAAGPQASGPHASGPHASGPGHWFTIPPHRPFLPDVAAALHRTLAPLGPEGLASAVVLTPTRRAARALAEAFVNVSGGRATLLPQIRTVGDVDADEAPFEPGDIAARLPPAVSPLRRRCELARIVAQNAATLGRRMDALSALRLADALAAFLDAAHIEEVAVTAERLEALAPPELARHWEVSTDFLKLALEGWPARLDELGLIDVAERRTALIRSLAEQWTARPPEAVLIAAGVHDDSKAIAALLTAVAAAPRGAAILPGLDLDLADAAWAQVDDAHPQGVLKRLLDRAGIDREDVQPWPLFGETAAAAARGRSRRRVVNEALRPPDSTDDWLSVIATLRAEGAQAGADPMAEGVEGLTVLAAADEDGVAARAALLLREALETPGKTAALVTPDPALARRVSARLSRWGVVVDSSAGAPLDRWPVGRLATLLAALVADPADPAALLAVAKHPLARLGRPAMELEAARRDLERRGLRGPRPRGWAELGTRLEAAIPGATPTHAGALPLARALQTAVEHARAPFIADGAADAVTAVRALAEAMESIAADEKGAPGELWAGPGGEAAAALVAGLIEDAQGLPRLTPEAFAELIGELMRREVVRSGSGAHPRLRILGLIEARLNAADRVVLAGLEEGVWPAAAATDPLLSRGMRSRLDLPSPERRIGVAAHDFAQAACAPEVVLITAARRSGQPATRSRWLWRLEMLAKAASLALPARPEVAAWSDALDAAIKAPPAVLDLAKRPAPRPPVSERPRELFATRVEEWIRDPYATYARYILRLRLLDKPDAPLEARARGTAIHKAFERFSLEHPQAPYGDAETFERMLLEALDAAGLPRPGVAREQPLARRLGLWAAQMEAQRRPGADLLIEASGALAFDAPGGPFTVRAKADRLEVRADRIDVIDFKSGGSPSRKEVKAGLAPQLTLTAAIASAGGFEGAPALPPGELIYGKVTGRRTPGELVQPVEGESGEQAAIALYKLKLRVAVFDRVETPYTAKAVAKFIRADGSGDYDHLQRLWEWRVVGEDGEEGGE